MNLTKKVVHLYRSTRPNLTTYPGRSKVTLVPRPTASKTGWVIKNVLEEFQASMKAECMRGGGGGWGRADRLESQIRITAVR